MIDINKLIVIISQYRHISNHGVMHFKFIQCLNLYNILYLLHLNKNMEKTNKKFK